MFYFFWITYTILLYILYAVFSKWANDESHHWRWVVILWTIHSFGIWPLVAKYTKNIVADALLYDILVFFSFYFVLLYLGSASKFTIWQWTGTFFVIMGYFLLKIGK
jgi:hypothetical protein